MHPISLQHKIASLVFWQAALLLLVSLSRPALAQTQQGEARTLVRSAMTAYFNLDLKAAQDFLETAIKMAPNLDRGTLADIYSNYGVLWVGGFFDNAKGHEYFLIALCLDPTTAIDPMVMTPDIGMIFKMAQMQTNPSACQKATAGVTAMRKRSTHPPIRLTPPPKKPKPPSTVEPVHQTTGKLMARRISGTAPEYPAKARRERWESTIKVEVHVGRDGKIEKHLFLEGHPVFQNPVTRALKSWRFDPYLEKGRLLKTYGVIKFKFSLE
ncbi:MAG: energy transducer TonB [Myxococcota bacterium]|nr:energy transducer TonB [Myxococcota bacterium]